jgi:hypothetical protein
VGLALRHVEETRLQAHHDVGLRFSQTVEAINAAMLTLPWIMTGVWSTADNIDATNHPIVTQGKSMIAAATWTTRTTPRVKEVQIHFPYSEL